MMTAMKHTMHWQYYELEELGIGLDVFADMSAFSLWKDGHLTALIQDLGAVRIALWAGPGQTIDSWRTRLNAREETRFEEETEVFVCGRKGLRQVATVTEQEKRGTFIGQDGTLDHSYTDAIVRVHVCVGFSHLEQDILQCWMVEKDHCSALAQAEFRFFSSLRCFYRHKQKTKDS